MIAKPLKRRQDWRQCYSTLIGAIRRKPFAYGEHDCAMGLSAAMVEALTGIDVAKRWRGRYASRTGALRVMRNDGFANVADMVATVLPEIHPARARIGDIAAIPDDGPFGFALGVVNGERIFVIRAEGLGTVDLLTATRAFSVG